MSIVDLHEPNPFVERLLESLRAVFSAHQVIVIAYFHSLLGLSGNFNRSKWVCERGLWLFEMLLSELLQVSCHCLLLGLRLECCQTEAAVLWVNDRGIFLCDI